MLLSDIYLWLAASRVSTSKLNKILKVIGPQKLWDGFAGECRYDLNEKAYSSLKRTHSVEYIERTKQYLAAENIEYITLADPAYPPQLSQSEVDPPPALFYKGDISLALSPCIAVVGTRRSSPYGRYAANKIAGELAAAGICIVSGLATGIDGYAHAAALEANGKTIAVLGSGLFNVSPVSNIPLFDEICKKGLVLSEYMPDVPGAVYTFPERNRIISGLSKGVIVVEAAQKSGSLMTASCALEQGRDVFAVPGDIDKVRSVGTNSLIKQGATPITCAQDVLDFYGMDGTQKRASAPELDMFESAVYSELKNGERSFDALVEACGFSAGELSAALSSLMIYGLIHERSKNIYGILQ